MRGQRKTMIGNVVSDKMNKTVVVTVETSRRHPLYGKVVRSASKHKAHDEENACRVGDRVLLIESRPLSSGKRWVVQEILERAE